MDFFEDLYKLVEKTSIFDELIEKSGDGDFDFMGLDEAPSTRAVNPPAPVATKPVEIATPISPVRNATPPESEAPASSNESIEVPKATKISKKKIIANNGPTPTISITGGSGGQSETHGSTNLDPSLVPVKQSVTTPNGVQQKTFHQKVGGAMNGSNPSDQATQPTQVEQKEPQPINTSSPDWDDKAQYYHDNLKVGDVVGFKGHSSEHGHHVPVESEVIGLNPNGQKHIHVKPLSKKAKKNPNAEPLPLHYAEVTHAWKANPDDPNKKDYYQYNGEYQKPSEDAPAEAEVEKKLSPEEIIKKIQQRNEVLKEKHEQIKKHVKSGDVVEFYRTDPNTGKIVLEHGLVTDFAGTTGDKNSKGKAKTPTSFPVQTADGIEEVPFDRINRFGKHIVNRMYMHKFNHDKKTWDIDDDKLQDKTQYSEDSIVPKEKEAQDLKNEQDAQQKQAEQSPEPIVKDDELESYARVMDKAGVSIDGVENGVAYFTIPGSDEMFHLATNKVTPEAISEIIKANTPKQEFGEDNHWLNKYQSPNARKRILSSLSGVMQHVGQLPVSIIAAKNNLLHPKNENKYLESALAITKFLKDPLGFTKTESPKNADYFKQEHGLDISDPTSLDKSKLLTVDAQPTENQFLRNKQQQAATRMSKVAEDIGAFDLANKMKIDPTKDNTDLLHFYKAYLDREIKQAGAKPIKLDIPSVHQANLFDHLDELTSKMESSGLNHSHYQEMVDRLNHFIEKNPDNPEVDKLFNELNDYVHKNGKNDPHEQMDVLKNALPDIMKAIDDPDEQKAISDIIESKGASNPSEAMKQIQKLLKKYGEYEPEVFDGQNKDTEQLNYINSKLDQAKENKLSTGREPQQVQEFYSNGLPKPSPSNAASVTPQPSPSNAASVTPQYTPSNNKASLGLNQGQLDQSKNKIMKMNYSFEGIVKNPKALQKFLSEAGGLALKNSYENDLESYNQNGTTLAQQTGKPFEPMVSIFDESKDTSDSGEYYDKLAEQQMNDEGYDIQYMKNTVQNSTQTINLFRKFFLKDLDKYSPDVKDNLKAIDAYTAQKIKANDWFSQIPESLATTEVGKKFLAQINSQINRVSQTHTGTSIDREKIFKAMPHDIESEKVLARRDFAIALKKSFGENSFASEFNHYLDEIVDNVMTAYPNIPVKVKKSVVRHFIKCINHDVIKNNNDISMNKSLQMVYNEDALKSMLMKISLIATDLKSINQPIFFINLNDKYDRDTKVDYIDQNITKSEWLKEIKNIQEVMMKSGLLEQEVSENRLKKFVLDNDHETIQKFYNGQVDIVRTPCQI